LDTISHWANSRKNSGVKAGRRQSQEPEYLSGPPHSSRECGTKKLLRKKKNESWAMRPRPYKSDSLSWRSLVCEIVQFGFVFGERTLSHLRYSPLCRSSASRRKRRRLLHQAKRKLSKWSSPRRVLIFRSINRLRA